jgi:hypothetical protein
MDKSAILSYVPVGYEFMPVVSLHVDRYTLRYADRYMYAQLYDEMHRVQSSKINITA